MSFDRERGIRPVYLMLRVRQKPHSRPFRRWKRRPMLSEEREQIKTIVESNGPAASGDVNKKKQEKKINAPTRPAER